MKSFTEFLIEKRIDISGDFLKEGFEEAKSELIALYKKIKSERDAVETKEEKTEVIAEYSEPFKNVLDKCILASLSDGKFFSTNQETQIRILVSLLGLTSDRYTTYLSMSEASDEEKEEWEKAMNLEAAGLKDEDDEEEPKSDEKEPDEDEETNSEPDVGKKTEDDEEDDSWGGYKGLGKIKDVDDEAVEKFIATKSTIPNNQIVKKVIVVVDEQIGDVPDRGTIGETSVVESSILSVDSIDHVAAIMTNPKTFKTARDFTKKIDALKLVTKIDKNTGSEIKEKHPIKLFIFDKTSIDRGEDPWTIETK